MRREQKRTRTDFSIFIQAFRSRESSTSRLSHARAVVFTTFACDGCQFRNFRSRGSSISCLSHPGGITLTTLAPEGRQFHDFRISPGSGLLQAPHFLHSLACLVFRPQSGAHQLVRLLLFRLPTFFFPSGHPTTCCSVSSPVSLCFDWA